MPTFFPKRAFTLSGSNMNFTRRVMFGQEEVTEFEYLDKTGISGVVPAAAYTQELTIESNAATLNLGVQQNVPTSDKKITALIIPRVNIAKSGITLDLTVRFSDGGRFITSLPLTAQK